MYRCLWLCLQSSVCTGPGDSAVCGLGRCFSHAVTQLIRFRISPAPVPPSYPSYPSPYRASRCRPPCLSRSGLSADSGSVPPCPPMSLSKEAYRPAQLRMRAQHVTRRQTLALRSAAPWEFHCPRVEHARCVSRDATHCGAPPCSVTVVTSMHYSATLCTSIGGLVLHGQPFIWQYYIPPAGNGFPQQSQLLAWC